MEVLGCGLWIGVAAIAGICVRTCLEVAGAGRVYVSSIPPVALRLGLLVAADAVRCGGIRTAHLQVGLRAVVGYIIISRVDGVVNIRLIPDAPVVAGEAIHRGNNAAVAVCTCSVLGDSEGVVIPAIAGVAADVAVTDATGTTQGRTIVLRMCISWIGAIAMAGPAGCGIGRDPTRR